MSEYVEKVRPQDDLFRAVNGEWLENTTIPSDKPRWGSFDILAEESLKVQRELLEDSGSQGSIPLSFRLYSSYMDVDAIETRGVAPLVELLAEVENLASWGDLNDWLVKNYSTFGLLPLRADVYNDLDNPDFNTLHFAQGGLSLPDESYYREPQYQELRELATTKLQNLVDYICTGTVLSADAAKVFKFESAIAKLHWDAARCRIVQETHNPMLFSQACSLLADFHLDELYTEVDGDTVVDINQVDFFENMQTLWNAEHFLEWKNWAKCHLVEAFANVLTEKAEALKFEYTRIFSGMQTEPPRWKKGVSLVNSFCGDEIGQVYVEKYFPPEAREQMENLVENLIKAYRKSIGEAKWLSSKTKEKALVKLSKFTYEIGLPKHWHDYSDLQFQDALWENMLSYLRFNYSEKCKKIGQPVDKLLWHMTPQTVNAYYNPPENVIVFPAAILQPPFFDPNRPEVENYGGIGAVIGHEIGHGFDDQGSEYGGDGELENWWLEEDKAKFNALTDKLNAQFDKFVPLQLEGNPDAHVNGKLTTGENVGDLAGLKIALLSYSIARGFETIDELLLADRFSVQKFFEAFALLWRNKATDEFATTLLAIDPHSPAEFRANTVRNLDAFQVAFDVKPGDGMYVAPEERVDIW
ncbi:MAG: M13 family metallopeptidase [Candidatus Ancillula sp.]|jgi:putative endopeptidase|nr:M13 family metallopeptidase [Candidatus Ancillula sp.]